MQQNHFGDKHHTFNEQHGHPNSYSTTATETLDPDSTMLDAPAKTLVTLKEANAENTASQVETKQRTDTISVLLVDDHALVREGLRRLLELEPDLNVVDESVNGIEAIQKIRKLRPDVVLMDISMPIVDGIAVTRQVVHEFPSIAVIILTMYRQSQQVLQAMKNGARGYLLKSASSQEVAQAIRHVHEGDMLIEPELTSTIVNEFRRLSNLTPENSSIHTLSDKELEIIRYVAAGMSNREIAGKLAYSEKTVKNYLSVIFQKLGIRDRTQAAIFAIRQGLIPDEEWEHR